VPCASMRDAAGRTGIRFYDDPTAGSAVRASVLDRRSRSGWGAVRPGRDFVGSDPKTFAIRCVADATVAREYAKSFAVQSGFRRGDQIVIGAVLDEMATNMLNFAGTGELVFCAESDNGGTVMVIVARDQGPGISDLSSAFADGYSTLGRPGLGLAASRRLMDTFDIASAPGEGTTITMKKWRESHS
jgi:serine/threonine-protein kinase RsbT